MVQSAVSGGAVLQTYFLINNLDVISTGYLNQNRQRPLFARSRQYERQRIHVQHPNLPIPTAPSLHKAVRPSLAAVTHVLHATAASSMQSASAGRQTRYVRRKHKEHRHTETKTQKFNTK
ncbi:hypothetical protein D9C73_022149 [Collichthys lucidus]|uniref:Uncharacterized protein n=1 Tax=Collichthys lucidus TaxID=240159 RepID=A0A4U5VLI7_COLLU|nr:hypothetical protein D9C73_022149 [Collichthys lucidus]